jgi:16S rRNA (adenine1518-N6/adenine1519-N6)-dimethyltransferase
VFAFRRKKDYSLPCGEKLFLLVKTAFQQRREDAETV